MQKSRSAKLASLRLGGLILAGGRASRLHNKCLRRLDGKPLIVHVFERVSRVTRETVVAARTQEQVKNLMRVLPGVRIVLDHFRLQSPLVGFLSGLSALNADYVFATGCDNPLVQPRLMYALFKLAEGNDCVVPVWEGKLEPLLAVYERVAALRASQKSIQHGQIRMLDMIARLPKPAYVPATHLVNEDPKLLSFQNVNTESDLAKARRILDIEASFSPQTQ